MLPVIPWALPEVEGSPVDGEAAITVFAGTFGGSAFTDFVAGVGDAAGLSIGVGLVQTPA